MNNSNCEGNGVGNARDQAPSTYVEFLVTRPLTFTKANEPVELNNWLRIIESKFRLLCCTEHQKTLFASKQLLGTDGPWWANFTRPFVLNTSQRAS
jgi:hypothetical protein